MSEAVGTTLSKFIADEQKKTPGATGELSGLLSELITCAKIISREVNKAGLVEILGLTGHRNVQGEEVMKLDVFANETIVKNLSHTGRLCIMAGFGASFGYTVMARVSLLIGRVQFLTREFAEAVGRLF